MSAPRPVYFLAEEAQAKLDDDDFSYDYENDLRYEFAEWRDGFVLLVWLELMEIVAFV